MQPHTRRRALLAAALLAATSGLVAHQMAGATLSGTSFEGNDGNIVVNGAGAKDWANVTPNIGPDQATGQCDNSFTQGSKEDETVIVIGLGSIPNSKADLGKFAVFTETASQAGPRHGHVIMDLAWIRNNDSGTTNFDFEINQAAQPSMLIACGQPDRAINLVRTGDGNGAGVDDVLISYDLQGGAQNPTLSYRRWTGTQWSAPTMLNAADSEGRTNFGTAITLANSGPFAQAIAADRFGEASIDLTAAGIIGDQDDPGPCVALASVFVKSRSSNSFSAQMKDYIAPIPTGFDTCGSLTIDKVTIPGGDTQQFTFTPSANLGASFQLADATTPKNYPNLSPGNYSVAETVPSGWDLTSAVCSDGSPVNAIVIGANEDVTCTFTNTKRGKVIIDKVTNPNPDPTNTSFSFTGSFGPFELHNLAANGIDNETFDSGAIVPGVYNVAETGETGWTLTDTQCSDGSPVTAIDVSAGETVTCTFTNDGYGRIEVTKQTDPDGATQSFSYATTGTGYVGFNLTDGQTNGQNVAPGTYTVAETVPADWELSDIVCVDPTGAPAIDKSLGKATISVAPGELVTCLYTNEENASITVTKTVVGPDPGQSFSFTSNFGVPNLANGGTFNSADVGDLDPGTYNVTEDGLPNWLLTNADPAGTNGGGGNVVCSDQSNSGAINLSAGEHVLCAFTNEWQVGAVAVHKTIKHADQSGAFPGDLSGFNFTIIDANGIPVPMPPTDANGYTCVDSFGFQTVTVHEEPRDGYQTAADQQVVIDHVAYCPNHPGQPYGGAPSEAASPWINIPLTRIAVSVDSLIDGGTASAIICVDENGDTIDQLAGGPLHGNTDASGDGGPGIAGTPGWSANLAPGLYTCSIVIDP